MFELAEFIAKYYEGIRREAKEEIIANDVSETLVTKILMGVLGCCPAYDSYFRSGLSIEKVGTQRFNKKSILELVNFYEDNSEKLEDARKNGGRRLTISTNEDVRYGILENWF